MKRSKVLLKSALIGAVAGGLTVRLVAHWDSHFADSLIDSGAIKRWPWIAATLGWIAFSLYWEVAARNSAESQTRESSFSRGIHVLLANAALILELAPLRGMSRIVPASTAILIAGLTVEAAGLFLTILARRHLGRNWSGEISIKVDHRLIRSGPYRYLRHPIYTGLLAMYAGTAVVTGTWPALFGFVLAVVAYTRKIRLEEVNLRVAFRDEYEAYRRDSWALLPGLF